MIPLAPDPGPKNRQPASARTIGPMRSMNPRLAAVAALLLAAGAPAVAQEGKDDEPAPAPAPAPVPARGGEAPTGDPTAGPKTIAEAYARLEVLRRTRLDGAGAWVRVMDGIRAVAVDALGIDAKSPSTGEDLHRLAEICFDAGRYEEAAGFARKYLAPPAPGSAPPTNPGHAHAILVRAIAKTGKPVEADAAFLAYRQEFPKADGLAPTQKAVGDAYLAAGRIEDAAERYRRAMALHPRPLRTGSAATVQAYCETLVALGHVLEAHAVAEKAASETPDGEAAARVRAVLRRADATGQPFAASLPDLWLGATGPTAEALRGKVVVWHFFAWWLPRGREEIDAWQNRAADLAARGILVLPVTRTAGYDPETEKFDAGKVKTEEEAASIEKLLKERGWKGPFGVSVDGRMFAALRIRGVPTEIVVGRDGRVRFIRGGSEGGQALTIFAAERAAAEPAPAASDPATPPPKEPPPAPPQKKE